MRDRGGESSRRKSSTLGDFGEGGGRVQSLLYQSIRNGEREREREREGETTAESSSESSLGGFLVCMPQQANMAQSSNLI